MEKTPSPGPEEGSKDQGERQHGLAHVPVLVRPVLQHLRPRSGGRYLDGTVGLGGHSQALLQAAGGSIEVLGLDRDAAALDRAAERLEAAGFSGQVHLMQARFSRFREAMAQVGWDKLHGALLDLGLSSLQLDSPERGFSLYHQGPLDMRMGQGEGVPPASQLVNRAPLERLKRIIRDYGEEPLAAKIAGRIVKVRQEKPIESTLELAEIVRLAYPPQKRHTARNHPATRTFQALRIAANEELEELKDFLEHIGEVLQPGARVAVISFHSLEDRMVKQAFKKAARSCSCPETQPQCSCSGRPRMAVLTKKPIVPDDEELEANRRSRSARLRVAEALPKEG
jgi:16S rRNA (cytosine1402-N4)-methyltransferase